MMNDDGNTVQARWPMRERERDGKINDGAFLVALLRFVELWRYRLCEKRQEGITVALYIVSVWR